MALQKVGESTCSLGEIKNRADVVIFWGVDPTKSHPRHMERSSADPMGLLVPNGRPDRTVIVIDVEPNETSELADIFIQVNPEQESEAIWMLRCFIRGLPFDTNLSMGTSLDVLRDLAERQQFPASAVGVGDGWSNGR